ncbi:parallel beta-helix repeat (two copies) [Chthonomonas calidirosea]|uniref:right-handed parallel beta-helix repeat-containing protein n=1 Tax=Chthonomonas calidirosea TaxID=454171 RepID=UPI0006DD489A|nr:right-handed parallel beta-helix repeat-containing protein [Chthonomonas calidirosea]CEK13412.1 parallel beta-helix repeat (two copies) [Chthonomonas calidirosea]
MPSRFVYRYPNTLFTAYQGMLYTTLLLCPFSLQAQQVVLKPNSIISKATIFRPGTYTLEDRDLPMLVVRGQNFTLDLRNVRIRGAYHNRGIGIYIVHSHNITIRHANVAGCLYGILIENCRSIRILDSDLSHNGCPKVGTIIDESGNQPQDQWGAGILVRNSAYCSISNSIAQYAWDGIDLVRSQNCILTNCALSYNNNWGIHLWQASHNIIRNNRAIWCTTGAGQLYQALGGWSTLDSAGICLEHASSNNLVEGNDFRFGGDGIFVRANEGPLVPGHTVPPRFSSDNNCFRNNDCSFSPNNAIEVDLVANTIIEQNNCSNSNYGLWLGYSRNTKVRGNECINDTTRAVEIENGQNILLEGNVFGFDVPKQDTPLVYLRQNGRDSVPSGPYRITGNLFYGARTPLKLLNTQADLFHNFFCLPSQFSVVSPTSYIEADPLSHYQNRDPVVYSEDDRATLPPLPYKLQVGKPLLLSNLHLRLPLVVPVVELNGIPLWVKAYRKDHLKLEIPTDFWDRPHASSADLRLFDGYGWSHIARIAVDYPASTSDIQMVMPNPMHPGDIVTLEGRHLGRGRLRVNGKIVWPIAHMGSSIRFQLPYTILTSRGLNLLLERQGEYLTPPLSLFVEVLPQNVPHLIEVRFEPKTLHVGELLKVTFVLKNNLPVAAPLMQAPKPGFVYNENQSWQQAGYEEEVGTLELAVTSDHPGDLPPGLWPYRFGFGQATLPAHQTLEVKGFIRVQTPGTHLYRAGLVVAGERFIDDGVFPTQITVLP